MLSKLSNLKLKIGYVIGLSAAMVVGGATTAAVMAAIPDPSGVIHGCYRSNGTLSVIDSATQACGTNETALNWNQTGPAGTTGATGPQGPQGPAGANGSAPVSNIITTVKNASQTVLSITSVADVIGECTTNSNGNTIPLVKVQNTSASTFDYGLGRQGLLAALAPGQSYEDTEDGSEQVIIRMQTGQTIIINKYSGITSDSNFNVTGCKFMASAISS